MPTKSQDLYIAATDGYRLAATVHAPVAGPAEQPVTIIGSAVAVRRRFYDLFARTLAERGRTVLTFDYRGIGGSRPETLAGFDARMRDWGSKDIAGALAWARDTFPRRDIHWVGHSFGGFGIGLADNNHLVRRHLGIATPYTYWGLMDAPEKWRVGLMMSTAVPLLVPLVGRLPGRFIGGEDIPAGIALEWARWIRNPEMFFDDPTLPESANFARLEAPICFMRFADDAWSSDAGVAKLSRRFSRAGTATILRVTAKQAGGPIGHFGFFKPQLANVLWPQALAWLEGRESAEGTPA